MKRFSSLRLTPILVLLACSERGGPEGLFAPEPITPSFTETADPATVTTDRGDYQPGDTVTITGAGWLAGESVRLDITENPPNHPDHLFFVTADSNGAFVHRQLVMDANHVGVTFELTATGQSSGAVANATFTDGLPQQVALTPGSRTVAPGESAEYATAVTMGGNSNPCTILLEVITALPAGATASFSSPNPHNATNVDFTRTLTIATTAGTPEGTYSFTVRATRMNDCQGSAPSPITTGTLVVEQGDTDPPVVTNVQASPNPTNGSVDVVLTANAADGLTNVVSAAYNIDGGGFVAMSASDGVFDELSEDVIATIAAATVAALAEGNHLLCVRATDLAGNTSTPGAAACTTLLVDKTPPVVANVDASPNPVANGSSTTISAQIADALSNVVAAQYSTDSGATWNPFPAFTPAGAVSVEATVNLGTGVYDVCVRATDAAANTSNGTTCTLLAVYDPTAGFVTGGGWIWSPLGASTTHPMAEGKATFGFVSRYKKGANKPDGNTQFQFKAADLNFHADLYDWLVVAGARAQYKGRGTINGTGDYGFLLTAIDGELIGLGGTDQFRIKIWEIATGYIVYDNQMGKSDAGNDATSLGGGSVVIHAK